MTGKEESVIALPKDVWGSQMFLSNKKLIIIAGKSAPYIAYQNSMIAHDQKVSVMIYDVTNAQAPKLQSAYEYDGYVQESRVIDGKLVLVTSQSFNWGPVYLQRDKMMQSASPESIKASDFTISVRDVLPSWTSLQPTTINYKNGTSKLITTKKTTQVNCANVLYTKPNPA